MYIYVTSYKFIKLICYAFIGNKNQKHQLLSIDVDIINNNVKKMKKELKLQQVYIKTLEDEAIRLERMNERLRTRLEGINYILSFIRSIKTYILYII